MYDADKTVASFQHDFMVSARRQYIKNDSFSYADEYLGLADGDTISAPSLKATAKDVEMQTARSKQAFAFLYNHVDDKRLKGLLDDLRQSSSDLARERGLARSAWQLVMRECGGAGMPEIGNDLLSSFERTRHNVYDNVQGNGWPLRLSGLAEFL